VSLPMDRQECATSRPSNAERPHDASASSRALASYNSSASNPSVNQPPMRHRR
jgi:hypothetical protein